MANQVMLASNFGKEVADLLGLKQTRKITIEMDYNDFVRITVDALLTKEDGKSFTGYLQTRKYHLVLDSEEEPVDLRDDSGIADVTENGDTHRKRVL